MSTRAPVAVLLSVVLALLPAACDGGAGGDWEAFCDLARELEPQLQEADGTLGTELDETALGAIRQLSREAPLEIRDDLNVITEAETLEEMQNSVDEVEEALERECDIVL